MFKYISEILTKFTQKQRILALIILSVSIIIISIGPKITELFTNNNEELTIRIESQKTQILELTKRVNELSTEIINNQKDCTERMVKRENEIMNMINEIDNYVNHIKNETHVLNSESHNSYTVPMGDTLEKLMCSSSNENNTTTIIQNKRDEKLIKMVKKLKRELSDNNPK